MDRKESFPIAKEAEEKLDRARTLVEEGKHEEALACYLFAFDNRNQVSGWGGVGLSLIPNEIADLGKVYPAARQALIERRDSVEEKVLSGDTAHVVLSTWTSLNKYLGESARELKILKTLEEAGQAAAETRQQIIHSNYGRYLHEKRYDEIGEFLNHFGWLLWAAICAYEADRDFPRIVSTTDSDLDEMLVSQRLRCRKRAIHLYEVALGSRHDGQADLIRNRVLVICPEEKTHVGLVLAAIRTGRKDAAQTGLTKSISMLKPRVKARLQRLIERNCK